MSDNERVLVPYSALGTTSVIPTLSGVRCQRRRIRQEGTTMSPEERMQHAIDAVKEGVMDHVASKAFIVAKKRLHRRRKAASSAMPAGGPLQLLPVEEQIISEALTDL